MELQATREEMDMAIMAAILRTELRSMPIVLSALTHNAEILLEVDQLEVLVLILIDLAVEINRLRGAFKEKQPNTTLLMVYQTTEGSIGVR